VEQKKVVLETLQRAGNEFLFQMQMMNIEVLNGYEAKKIITCPHCFFNTIKMNILNWVVSMKSYTTQNFEISFR
jgi:hypothetical protein